MIFLTFHHFPYPMMHFPTPPHHTHQRRMFVLTGKRLFYYEGTDMSSCVKKVSYMLHMYVYI